MSDFQIEAPSLLLGFLAGAGFWTAAALLSPSGRPRKAAKAGGRAEEPLQPAPAAPSEPGPEPAPAYALRLQQRSLALQRLLVGTGTTLLLLLAASAVAAALHSFAPPAPVPPEAAPAPLEVVLPPPEAVLPPPEAALPPPEAEERAEEEEAASVEVDEQLEGALSDEESKQGADRDDLITLSLTRQQISIPQEDGVYYKTAYWGTISVGEPPVPFSVVFDTGSGHLILPSTYCHTDTCRAHRRYRRSLSATARDIDYDGSVVLPGEQREHITVSFGTGEVAGVFVEDVVCMGSEFESGERLFDDNVTAKQGGAVELHRAGLLPSGCVGLRMIAATDMSEDPFKDFQFDGVLGLGLSGLSQAPEFNAMHVVAGQAQKASGRDPHVFAVFLAQGEEEESEITMGGYSQDHLEDDLAWQPVHDPALGQWMIRIKSVRINDWEPLNFCTDGECRAIVDTGTSLIAVPSTVFPELFEQLTHPAVGKECEGPGPKLNIELEGITVTLEPRDYGVVEAPSVAAPGPNASAAEEPELCKAMLMALDLPRPLGPKLFVLGEPVLRRYYTVFDSSSNPRVGFGRARHSRNKVRPTA